MIRFKNLTTGIIQELPENSFERLMKNPRWAERLQFIEIIDTNEKKTIPLSGSGIEPGANTGATGSETGKEIIQQPINDKGGKKPGRKPKIRTGE